MSTRRASVWIAFLAIASPLVALAAPPAAEGPDETWSVTTTTNMVKPMPMSMPAMTHTVCVPPNTDQKPPPMKGADCKLQHFDKQGKRVTFAATCQMQGGEMTGKGWTERADDAHYSGHMDLTGNVSGMPMEMHVDYAGTRTGHCTAAK